jgi:hypothetical protein
LIDFITFYPYLISTFSIYLFTQGRVLSPWWCFAHFRFVLLTITCVIYLILYALRKWAISLGFGTCLFVLVFYSTPPALVLAVKKHHGCKVSSVELSNRHLLLPFSSDKSNPCCCRIYILLYNRNIKYQIDIVYSDSKDCCYTLF